MSNYISTITDHDDKDCDSKIAVKILKVMMTMEINFCSKF